MRRKGPSFVSLVLALIASTWCGLLAAAEVRGRIAGDDPGPWRVALEGYLDRSKVTLSLAAVRRIDRDRALRDRGAEGERLAVLWLDVREDAVVLILTAGDRALVRELPRTAGDSDEVIREKVALVVATAIETLVRGRRLALSREQAREELGLSVEPPEDAERDARGSDEAADEADEPDAGRAAPTAPAASKGAETAAGPGEAMASGPATGPSPAEAPAYRLVGALGWEGQGYAIERVLIHGPAARLALGAPGLPLSPGIELFLQYRLPFEQRDELAGFSMQSGAMRLSVVSEPFTAEPATLRLSVGAGLDVLRIEPFATASDASPRPARTRVGPLARIGLGISLRLVGELSLDILASGDVDVIGTRYVVQRGEQIVPLVEPLRFRPSLSIGLSSVLAGRSRAPAEEVRP